MEDVKSAAYVLYIKIKISIAYIIIRSTPPGKSIEKQARMFQDKIRKSSKHYNLSLESERLYNQLLLILPLSNDSESSLMSEDNIPESMEIDESAVDSGYDSIQWDVLDDSSIDVQPPVHQTKNNVVDYVSFMEALIHLRYLSTRRQQITKQEYFEVLSKLTDQPLPNINHNFGDISASILRQFLRCYDVTHLASRCVRAIGQRASSYVRLGEMDKIMRVMRILTQCSAFEQKDTIKMYAAFVSPLMDAILTDTALDYKHYAVIDAFTRDKLLTIVSISDLVNRLKHNPRTSVEIGMLKLLLVIYGVRYKISRHRRHHKNDSKNPDDMSLDFEMSNISFWKQTLIALMKATARDNIALAKDLNECWIYLRQAGLTNDRKHSSGDRNTPEKSTVASCEPVRKCSEPNAEP